MAKTRFSDVTVRTDFWEDGTKMPSNQGVLSTIFAYDTKAYTIETSYASGAYKGEDRDQDSAYVLVYDPGIDTSGTATADGTKSTLIDDTRTEPDDFWKGIPIQITKLGGAQTYNSVVTGFDQSTGTIAFGEIYEATEEDDTYTLLGYPTLAYSEIPVENNVGMFVLDPTTGTQHPRTLYVVYEAVFPGIGGIEEHERFVGKITVRVPEYA